MSLSKSTVRTSWLFQAVATDRSDSDAISGWIQDA